MTNTEYVISLYSSMFGRTVTAADTGVTYWVDQMTAGSVDRANLIQTLIAGAQASTGSATDAAMLANKTTVGLAFAAAGLNNVTDATSVLSGVTADAATVTAAQTAIDEIVNPTTALTTGTDALTGTDANNKYSAVTSALTTDATLGVTDTIDGGAGNDTLTVNMNANFDGFTTGSLKNVENIVLNNKTAVARTFDATGVTGTTSYTIDGNDAGVNLTDLASSANVSLSNMDGLAASTTFTMSFANGAAELTGTADAMTFNAENLGTKENPATTATELREVTLTLNDIETVNLNSTGVNVVKFGGTDLKTLNVAGAGETVVNAVATSLTAFDASSASGNVTADLTATTSTLTTVKAGSGDDSITFDEVDAAANATLSGGAGTDTLTYNSNGGTVQYTMSGFETLALNNINTAGLTVSALNTTDLTTISSVAATAQAVSFVNLGAKDLTIVSNAATVDAGDISTDNTGSVTLNYVAAAATVTAKTAADLPLADYTFSAANALTVNVGEYTSTAGSTITAAKAASVTLNVASGKDTATTPNELTKFGGTLTAAEATSITVNATGALAAGSVISAAKATSATITNGSTAADLDLTAAALKNLTVTTNSGFTMTGATDVTGVQTANFTVNNGHFDMTGENLSGINSLTVAGSGTSTTLGASQFTVGDVGAATNDYNLNITATGLKGNLTMGALDVNTGYSVNLNVAGVTGNATVTTIGAGASDINAVTINAAGLGGNFSVDDITAKGDVNITSSAVGTTDIDAVTTDGNVNIALDGSLGTVAAIATITGNNVTMDLSNTIGGLTDKTYTVVAKSSADVAVSGLESSTVSLTAGTGSTAFTGKVTGGIDVDAVTFTSVATNTAMTLSGDYGLGTDSLTVDLNTNSHAATGASLAITATNYDAATIDLDNTNAISVALGTGADVDTLQWAGAVKATVTGFDTTEDKLSFNGAVAGVTATTGTAVTAGGVTAGALTDDKVYVINDGSKALTAAGTESITDYTSTTDVAAYLAEGYTSTAATDAAIFVINDLVADKTYVYSFLESAGGASTISAAELTLIGVITEETGSALVAGDIA